MVPFSATPTPIAAYLGGEFLCYLGCPGEMMSVGLMPLLENDVLAIRSYCECCFEPINLEIKQQTVLSADPAEPLVVVTGTPWTWERGVVCDFACDNFHFVLDREHGERFERQHGRRGTYLSLDQLARSGTAEVGRRRMRDPNDGPMVLDADAMVTHFEAVGIDVSEWKAITEQPSTSVPG
ncbi:hypothetical protein K7711_41330 [Nocardia sp. CA2R105]|uniref:organomercurial lyase n=1 Tax=Nocardia coffeae TaxID=2873381 RepID=UPI001CA71DFC|nr:organomercurial lyase [Nocardia coffeae]MBY8862973.1 hypothetical protein [Nocardia coffeae]